MLEHYHEPEELLSDESFLNWYFKTGSRTLSGPHADWDVWIAASPGRRELVQEAIRLLDTTRVPEKELPAGQLMAAEQALMDKLDRSPAIPAVPTGLLGKPGLLGKAGLLAKRRFWMAAAAVFLVLLASDWLINSTLFRNHPQVNTEYGQISRQQLPDGTEVVVNANSRISYSISPKDGIDREVWLKGEAFFHVRKTPLKSRFIVHTDHFDILVTGTQFNVVNRDSRDNVMLKEGSVIVHTIAGEELHMVPGDFVEFNRGGLEKRPVKNDSLMAWKEHKLIFDNTPLRELVQIINEQYGVDVKLEGDSIEDRGISAILPNNNLEVLLKALELTDKFDVVRKEGYIVIRSRP